MINATALAAVARCLEFMVFCFLLKKKKIIPAAECEFSDGYSYLGKRRKKGNINTGCDKFKNTKNTMVSQ